MTAGVFIFFAVDCVIISLLLFMYQILYLAAFLNEHTNNTERASITIKTDLSSITGLELSVELKEILFITLYAFTLLDIHN